jgi:HK97 family phage prohead protease
MTKKAKEKRILSVSDQARHTRALTDDQGNKVIEGYAAVFDQRSKLIWEWGDIFYEQIERGAFDQALAADDLDVILTYQHNQNNPLARLHKRKGVKSLELSVDDYGLKFRAVLANTQLANDTYELVQRGDLFECSFVFTVSAEGQRWDKTEEGVPLRYISNVSGLFDVSVVVNGAYANTDLQAAERSFKEHNEQEPPKPEEPTDNYFHGFQEQLLEIEK